MSGHSKWSTIKRKKAVIDAKRGKIFTRLLREIQIAAKMGGSNIEGNPRLKTAILGAKSMSVPADNIERAVKRGAGEVEGADYEEIWYEGYGAGGVACMVKVLTDNRVRTVAEVRHLFTKYSGNLGGTNSVSFQFEERGVITVSKGAIGEDELLEVALDAGAQDVKDEGAHWEVHTAPKDFYSVKSAIEGKVKELEAELRYIPQTTVPVSGATAESVVKLLDALDDLDDVQTVVSNFEMDERELEAIGS